MVFIWSHLVRNNSTSDDFSERLKYNLFVWPWPCVTNEVILFSIIFNNFIDHHKSIRILKKYNFFSSTKLKKLFSDGRQSGPIDGSVQSGPLPPSYSYDSMPNAESIPAYGSYGSKRRREKRELMPGYGQTSVQSKCIEPPRNVQDYLFNYCTYYRRYLYNNLRR